MPGSSNKRTSGSEKAAETLGRAELAAEFLDRFSIMLGHIRRR